MPHNETRVNVLFMFCQRGGGGAVRGMTRYYSRMKRYPVLRTV